MKPGQGRIKGSSFERTVAKQLKVWWGTGAWARTPLSGGWARDPDFDTHGDIVTTAKDFPFIVECKHYKYLDLFQVFKGKGLFWKWWRQADRSASGGKNPLLIFKINYQPAMFALYDENIGAIRDAELSIIVLVSGFRKRVVLGNWQELRKKVEPEKLI